MPLAARLGIYSARYSGEDATDQRIWKTARRPATPGR